MEEASERKRASYEESAKGPNLTLLRLGAEASVSHCSSEFLRIMGLQCRRAIKNITDTAEKVLTWPWIKSFDLWTTLATWSHAGACSHSVGSPG